MLLALVPLGPAVTCLRNAATRLAVAVLSTSKRLGIDRFGLTTGLPGADPDAVATRLDDIVESLPVPILVLRRDDGTVLYANSSVEALSGHSPAELIGRSGNEFWVDPSGIGYLDILGGGGEAGQGVPFRTKSGAIHHAAIHAKAIHYQGKQAVVVAMFDITGRQDAETQLRRKHEVLQAVNRLQDQFISDRDPDALFARLLRTAIEVTGSRDGLIEEVRPAGGRAQRAEYPAGSVHRPDDELLPLVLAGGKPVSDRHRVAVPLYAGSDLAGTMELIGRRDGYGQSLLDDLAPFFNCCGTLIAALRSALEHAEAQSLLSKLSLAVEQSPAAVVITDRDGAIEYVNPRFTVVTGYRSAEVIGKTPSFLKSGYMHNSLYRELWETVTSGQEWQGELYNKRKNGELYWCQAQISPVRGSDNKVTHLLGMFEDVSLRKRYEERLLHQSHFDQLTSLPNRILAFDRLCQALNQAHRDGRSVTVMQIDLDHFKLVNDSLGYMAGDAILVEATGRLQACVLPTDTVARLGSDQFIVILTDPEESPDRVARGILKAFAQSFLVAGTELFVSVTIGLTVAPADGNDPNVLMRNCGTAMTQAKEQGRNTYRFFTPDMNRQAAERFEIDTHLRHALRRGELTLHYQPLLDLAEGRTVGCEALLRWNCGALGPVSPERFIPLAEDTGLIVPIGDWVLHTACCQAKLWLDQGQDIVLAVNTSPRQLQHAQLVEDVARALDESGLPAERLELEVTEGFLIADPQHTAGILKGLDRLGVRLSLDDFGTGYSSLSSLKRYPFHSLKIDRTFIRDVLTDASDRALVNAIIAMARSLNLRVVAEGVETIEQLEFLRDQGCDAIQGFHYSRPLPATDFESFLRGP